MLPLKDLYQGRVLNLAHRGANKHAPENTMPAFEKALELGADGFELDVQMSFDDVPIILHDFELEKTTDGEGVPTEYTLEQLRAFDAGAHFDDSFAGTPIPTLAEVLDAFPQAIVNIEIKSLSLNDIGLERAIVNVIDAHEAHNRVIITSFNPFCLRRVRRLGGDLPIGHLTAPELPIVMRKGWVLFGTRPTVVHPQRGMADAAFIQHAHQKQKRRVNVWTVNEPEDMRRLIDLGVDGIITDEPDVLKQVLEERA